MQGKREKKKGEIMLEKNIGKDWSLSQVKQITHFSLKKLN